MNKRIALCSVMLLLAGFSCNKKDAASSDSSEVLVSVDGKPLLRLSELRQQISDICAHDQNSAIYAQLLPDFEERFFEATYPTVIFTEWAKRTNVASNPEYKKKLELMMRNAEKILAQEAFVHAHVGDVKEEDIKNYYEENKDKDPRLMTKAGSAEVKVVKFAQDAQAQEFLKKVAAKAGNLDAVAKEAKQKVVDLGKVTAASQIDGAIKGRILTAKPTPTTLIAASSDGKEFWVVKISKSEPAQYRPFEQIKDGLHEIVAMKKINEMLARVVPDYEKKYGIKVDRGYFERKRKEFQQKQQEAAAKTKEVATQKDTKKAA